MSAKPITQNRLSLLWQTNFLGAMQWAPCNALQILPVCCSWTRLVQETAFNNIEAE